MRPNTCRTLFERFPERGDALPQLTHHHVAAVEAEIAESFRPPWRAEPRRCRTFFDDDQRPGAFS
jgi:hypothetical protein